MTQTILDNDNIIKIETPKERLYRIRLDYYIELLNEINNLREKRIELIKSYKMTIFELDKEIQKEEWREKQRLKDSNKPKV